MNNRSECSIIKDLFPLYKDNKISEETKNFITEHIKNCDNCKAFYENLENIKENEIKNYKKVAKKIKHRRLAITGGVLVLIIAVIIVSTSTVQFIEVKGESMAPTIMDNENYMVNKWTYKFASPEKNDIVTYKAGDSIYIGRIIGAPGERVKVEKGNLYINGVKENTNVVFKNNSFISEKTLEKDEFFIIQDNHSKINENNIYVKIYDITGKVMLKEK